MDHLGAQLQLAKGSSAVSCTVPTGELKAGVKERACEGTATAAMHPLYVCRGMNCMKQASTRLRSGRSRHFSCAHPRWCQAVQSADSQLAHVINWAVDNKVPTDKIDIAQDLATDSGLIVAAKDLPAGDAVLAVQDSAWVSSATAQQTSIGAYIASLEPWLQLALTLLTERANPGSKLRSYISSLPSQLDSPLFWTDEELQLLQGTQLLESVLGYK